MAETLIDDNVELSDEKECLVKTTEILTSSLKEACEEGRKAAAKGSPEHFLEDGILGRKICKAYKNAFKSLNVFKRTAFDKLFQKYYSCPQVQDSFTDLTDVEDEWDQFLVDCDRTWQSRWDYCQVKRRRIQRLGPLDVKLTDARSGRMGAQRWLKETRFHYDMLLDRNREIYKAAGMGRTVAGVWNTQVLQYYSEQMLAKKQLPQDFEGLDDDKEQMGGDIVLDANGHYGLIHVSKSSTDRPSVEKLLDVIKHLDGPSGDRVTAPSVSSH